MIYFNTSEQKDVPGHLDWLHLSEKEVLSNFKFEKRKNDWLLGRWTAKNLLKQSYFSGLRLDEIEIRAGENKAPFVFVNKLIQDQTITISHSNSLSFCAAAKYPLSIGCDLEKIEKRSDFFIRDYYTDFEKIGASNYSTHGLDECSYYSLCWSAKEALMKAIRTGLSTHPKKIEVKSLQKPKASWAKIQLNLLPQNEPYFGLWKIKENFVFVIVSDKEIENLNQVKL